MLIVTVEGHTFPAFEEGSLSNKEGKAIERFSGQRISVFQDAELSTSDIDHATVLVWLCRRRNGEPDLLLDDVDFDLSKVTVERTDDPTEQPAPGQPADPTGVLVPEPNADGTGIGLPAASS
jgi:hypothetical protein